MLIFLIYWFITISGFSVLGYTAHKLYLRISGTIPNNPNTAPDLWFFAGFMITTVFTGWLSVFLPIDHYVQLGLLILILFCAILQFQALSKEIRFWWSQWRLLTIPWWLLTLYSLTAVLLALFMSARGIHVYDTGLYHIQNIEWIQQYAVVPGLGNLHSRFAFNSMVFPLQALFETNINGQLAYPLWGAVLLVVASRLLFETAKAAKLRQWNLAVFFCFLITAITAIHANHFSSPSTDVIGNLSVIYIASFIVSNPRSFLSKGFESWTLIALIILLPTFKLSNAILIVFLLIALNQLNGKKLLTILGLCVIIVIPFVIRNYFLSGYLVFPVAGIDIFSPDWIIPRETVEATRTIIQSWAILPGVDAQTVQEMPVKNWLPEWFMKYSIIHRLILVVNLLSALFWVIAVVTRKQKHLLWVHAAVLLNVVFWFFSAPDMRFAMGVLIFNAGMMFLYLTNFKGYSAIPRGFKYVLLLLPLLSWVYLSRFELAEALTDSGYWLTPQSGLSSPDIQKFSDPFVHYQPIEGDRCYDAPLPCTPENCAQLEMRGTTLGDGFRVTSQKGE